MAMKSSKLRSSQSRAYKSARTGLGAEPERASRILYVEIPRQDIALYRFLLEGYDNLAIMSVIDRYRAVVRLRFLSAAEQTLRQLMAAQGAKIIEVGELRLP